jgi:integrase
MTTETAAAAIQDLARTPGGYPRECREKPSRYWRETVEAAGLRNIKLHAARHTGATLVRQQGVPVAVIAAWSGHQDTSLTMRRYAHSQFAALRTQERVWIKL